MGTPPGVLPESLAKHYYISEFDLQYERWCEKHARSNNSLRVFYSSFCCWSFIGVWLTVNLLKSPEVFSLFWPILTMQRFGWFLLVLQFLTLPTTLPSLWESFQVHQLHLVSLSLPCSVAFSILLQGPSTYLTFFFLLNLVSFSHRALTRLSDSKSPQFSRTLLSILADFKNVVVWVISAHHPISKYSSPLPKPPEIVPSAPFTSGITVTLMYHSFFLVLS